MPFSIVLVTPDQKRPTRWLADAEPEVWLAHRLIRSFPPGDTLSLVIDGKAKRFELRKKSGRLAWVAEISVTPSEDFAGKPVRRLLVRRRSFTYFDPGLGQFLAKTSRH